MYARSLLNFEGDLAEIKREPRNDYASGVKC
jgi:hypothetical protein